MLVGSAELRTKRGQSLTLERSLYECFRSSGSSVTDGCTLRPVTKSSKSLHGYCHHPSACILTPWIRGRALVSKPSCYSALQGSLKVFHICTGAWDQTQGVSPCWPLLAWAQEPHVRANSTTHYLCDFWQMCHIFKFCCSFNPLLEFSVPSLSHRKLVLLHNSLWGHGLLPILTLNIKRTIYEFAHTLGVFVEVELRGWMIFTHDMFLKIYLYYF